MSPDPKSAAPPAFVRSLEHLVDFVDTTSVGLHWVSADGTIVWANPADYEPLGYTADEYIGRNITEFHADADVIADILRRLTAGERLHRFDARLKAKDGSIRCVQITSSALIEGGDTEPRFVHTRCFTQDITEQKQLERQRDRFVAILGHDLRNPLTSISLAADQLLMAQDIPAKHKKSIERIAKSSERMSRMVVDLIGVARILGRGMTVKREAIDFGEVCRRIVDEVEQANPGTSVGFEAHGDLRGDWDPDRLAQAVSNLVTNALRHGDPPFRVAVRESDGTVILEVSNRGLPIDADAIGGVFEPFSETASGHGLGLGLFIVREVVTAHGGSIDVRSSGEDGTILTSRWPKHEGGKL